MRSVLITTGGVRIIRFSPKETGQGDQFTTTLWVVGRRVAREDIVCETVPLALARRQAA